MVVEPMRPPFPKWYNPNFKCDYHAGVVGYSTENCFALKGKVQDLVREGWLKLKKKKTEETPDVNQNPLPNHGKSTVNAIDASPEFQNIDFVYHSLRSGTYLSGDEIVFCLASGASSSLKNKQNRIKTDDDMINMVSNDGDLSTLQPLVIHFKEQSIQVKTSSIPRPLIIQVPNSFKYNNDKVVPWNYGCQVVVKNETDVTNISGVSGMTRNLRCFKPETLRASQDEGQKKG